MESNFEVIFYTSEAGNNPVAEFIHSLSAKEQAKVRYYLGLLAQYGPELDMPHSKKMTGHEFYELRPKGDNRIHRIFYFYYVNNQAILLHAFTKKSPKTPSKELKTARKRMTDYLTRQEVTQR